jgi:hypothetical protein
MTQMVADVHERGIPGRVRDLLRGRGRARCRLCGCVLLLPEPDPLLAVVPEHLDLCIDCLDDLPEN